MQEGFLDHGDLFWVDLNPFINEYVLAKVINHSYFRETNRLGGPFYVYIYNYFTSDKSLPYPEVSKRNLYCHPLNCKLYFYHGLWRLIPIVKEVVTEHEVVDQVLINARDGQLREEVDLAFTDVNLTTLDYKFKLNELSNLETLDFYVDKEIQPRVFLEVIKNRHLDVNKLNGIGTKEHGFFQYFLERMKPILHFPPYLQIPNNERGQFDFDWRLMEQSKYFKDYKEMKSKDKELDPKFVFEFNVLYTFGIMDPIFQEFGFRATGRNYCALILVLIIKHKIINTPIALVESLANSYFTFRFDLEKDRDKFLDFFHNEILNEKNIVKYLPLMDDDYVEMFSGLTKEVVNTSLNYSDFQAEKSLSKYLSRYKYASGKEKIYCLNINADVLYEDYIGLLTKYNDLPNGEYWAEQMEKVLLSKFNMKVDIDYEIDDEASNCTLLFRKKKFRDDVYKFLLDSLSSNEKLEILVS